MQIGDKIQLLGLPYKYLHSYKGSKWEIIGSTDLKGEIFGILCIDAPNSPEFVGTRRICRRDEMTPCTSNRFRRRPHSCDSA